MTKRGLKFFRESSVAIFGALLVAMVAGCKTNCCSNCGAGRRPVITHQPYEDFAPAGQTLELGIKARGAGPLEYEWFYQPGDCEAAKPASELGERFQNTDKSDLKIIRSSPGDSGVYWCRVSHLDPKFGLLQTQSQPIYLEIIPKLKESPRMLLLSVPGYGVVKTSGPSKICNDVPKFVAQAPIAACSTGTYLWKPIAGAAQATVTIDNQPNAWIACKMIGAPQLSPCAGKGSLTFPNPPAGAQMAFTVYFTQKPCPTSVSITPVGIEGDCP